MHAPALQVCLDKRRTSGVLPVKLRLGHSVLQKGACCARQDHGLSFWFSWSESALEKDPAPSSNNPRTQFLKGERQREREREREREPERERERDQVQIAIPCQSTAPIPPLSMKPVFGRSKAHGLVLDTSGVALVTSPKRPHQITDP